MLTIKVQGCYCYILQSLRTVFEKLNFFNKESSKNNKQIYRMCSLNDIQQVFQRVTNI
jgi:hypothetical protein